MVLECIGQINALLFLVFHFDTICDFQSQFSCIKDQIAKIEKSLSLERTPGIFAHYLRFQFCVLDDLS